MSILAENDPLTDTELLRRILLTLEKIEIHLAEITDEKITEEDVEHVS